MYEHLKAKCTYLYRFRLHTFEKYEKGTSTFCGDISCIESRCVALPTKDILHTLKIALA